MGEEPDFDIDDIDPTKYYCILVDNFYTIGGEGDCSMDYVFPAHCCQIGQTLIDFLTLDRECNWAWRICSVSPGCAQKVVDIKGPYDSYAECDDDCP